MHSDWIFEDVSKRNSYFIEIVPFVSVNKLIIGRLLLVGCKVCFIQHHFSINTGCKTVLIGDKVEVTGQIYGEIDLALDMWL